MGALPYSRGTRHYNCGHFDSEISFSAESLELADLYGLSILDVALRLKISARNYGQSSRELTDPVSSPTVNNHLYKEGSQSGLCQRIVVNP